MSKLIDSHVSTKQAKLAIDALLKHNKKHQAEKEDSELLGAKEEVVWLNVAVKKAYPEKRLKPFSIPIARPIVDPRTTSICLITKDPQREYKELIEAQNVKFISRVVKKDVKAELERAVSSTYMHQNQGTCTSIKIAPTTFTSSQVLDNLTTALPEIIKHIKGGWENVQSLHIKTSGSTALPIWSCDLGSRWDGLGPVEEVGADEESESEENDEEEERPAPTVKEGKKRAAPAVPAGTASKKAKATTETVKESVPAKAKTAAKEASPIKAKAKIVEVVLPKAKAKTTAAAPAPAKKAIPQTPIVEESSGSESEPEPKAKSAAVKKQTASGIAQKKAKLLAAKGSSKGSKVGIVGKKKVSAR
ncbi:hypothetical protein RSAG8_05730, partial [Rhizoctonia solani AG-8 WAC10335]